MKEWSALVVLQHCLNFVANALSSTVSKRHPHLLGFTMLQELHLSLGQTLRQSSVGPLLNPSMHWYQSHSAEANTMRDMQNANIIYKSPSFLDFRFQVCNNCQSCSLVPVLWILAWACVVEWRSFVWYLDCFLSKFSGFQTNYRLQNVTIPNYFIITMLSISLYW